MMYLRTLAGLLLVLGVAAKTPKPVSMSKETAYSNIQSVTKTMSSTSDQCTKNTCCDMSKQTCDVSAFPQDQTTLVLPGGNTRCIFSYSTPYAFQVVPGDNDKVLFYFQGGGACWDAFSTRAGFCTTDANPTSLVGLFDRTNPSNPYRDYTLVQVLYCSGDVHGGNTTRPYKDAAGKPVIQVGLNNVQSTIDWIVAQQANGGFASTLSDLVVMGCSAGSMGGQIWSQQVLEGISWSKAAIIPDSYAGVFPPGSQGPLMYGFGICPWVDPSLQASCYAQTLTLQDVTELAMDNIASWDRGVAYSFIQSKTDAVQISFYVAVGASDPNAPANITEAEFYNEVNRIFERYNDNEIFTNYLVDGPKHCFTEENVVYSADTTGPNGNGAGGETMVEWISRMPLDGSGASVTTDCTGELLDEPDWQGTTYCDAALADKVFTV